jgi:hypothetical protein
MKAARLVDWLMEPAAASLPRVNVAKFAIGFCPGCRRLRSVASPHCVYCCSRAPVKDEDA